MNTSYDYKLNQQHREDLMREANNARMAQEAQPNDNRPNAAVAALGRTMIKLGERLQGESK